MGYDVNRAQKGNLFPLHSSTKVIVCSPSRPKCYCPYLVALLLFVYKLAKTKNHFSTMPVKFQAGGLNHQTRNQRIAGKIIKK